MLACPLTYFSPQLPQTAAGTLGTTRVVWSRSSVMVICPGCVSPIRQMEQVIDFPKGFPLRWIRFVDRSDDGRRDGRIVG